MTREIAKKLNKTKQKPDVFIQQCELLPSKANPVWFIWVLVKLLNEDLCEKYISEKQMLHMYFSLCSYLDHLTLSSC